MSERSWIIAENEIVFNTVHTIVWNAMRQLGREEDLNKNGLFDSRSGAINVWCSPEDQPEDYFGEVTQGTLDYPRNIVATLYGHYNEEDETYRLLLLVEKNIESHIIWSKDKFSMLMIKARAKLMMKNIINIQIEYVSEQIVKKIMKCHKEGRIGMLEDHCIFDCLWSDYCKAIKEGGLLQNFDKDGGV